MTRLIKDIYDDLRTLGQSTSSDIGEGFPFEEVFRPDLFKNHTGDSQVISKEFLKVIYDSILFIIPYFAKATQIEPNSVSTVYGFNSQWWDYTTAQDTERDNFLKNGYKEFYENDDMTEWLIDENNDFVQHKSAIQNETIYNLNITTNLTGETISIKTQVFDTYRYDDLFDYEKFFDPTIVKIETLPQLNDWLDQVDSVITILKASQLRYINTPLNKFDEVNLQLCTTLYDTSDLIETISVYQGFGITNVRQDCTIRNKYAGQQNTFTVFMDDEGGTLPTTDPVTGLSFGVTAQQLRQYALDNWVDTYDGDGGFFSGGYLQYFYDKTVVDINGIDYDNELYNQNFSYTIKTRITSDLYNYTGMVGPLADDYNCTNYTYNDKSNEWDADDIVKAIDQLNDISIIGEIRNTEESIFPVSINPPVFPTEGSNTYGFTFGGTDQPNQFRTIENFDTTYLTVVDLLAP